MQRCLQLAQMGAGKVSPNPMVGAVLVFNKRIIGEGYHQIYGEAHAEVNCINSVSKEDEPFIPQGTMYVSLEPCAHFGKTPPCTDLIIRNRISSVVIGCRDSFKEVNGRGIEKLITAGIYVVTGILEKESIELNRRFFTFHEKLRPYVILKWAQSSDFKIAGSGPSRSFISNEFTNRLIHKWRSEEASILVGTNTALQDDPELTTRLWPGSNPLRLVIDTELKLPHHLKIFDGNVKTIVFNKLKNETGENLCYHQLHEGKDMLSQVMTYLHSQQVQSMIVEGGSKLLQSFIDAGLWDEARVITNSAMLTGDGLNAPLLKNEKLTGEQRIGNDIISFYTNDKN